MTFLNFFLSIKIDLNDDDGDDEDRISVEVDGDDGDDYCWPSEAVFDCDIETLLLMENKYIEQNRIRLNEINALQEKYDEIRDLINLIQDDIKLVILKEKLANKKAYLRKLKLSIAKDEKEVQINKKLKTNY